MQGGIFPDILRESIISKEAVAVLLCTDGFWENVTEDSMEKTLGYSYSLQEWLDKMETCICSNGKELDNYSAITFMIQR